MPISWATKELKSVQDMHDEEHILKSDAELKKYIEDVQKPLMETYRETALKNRRDDQADLTNNFAGNWEALDDSMKAIADYLKGGTARRSPERMRQALRKNYFKADSEYFVEEALDAAHALAASPSEYFEAKAMRGVKLNEFAGAVVPDNVSQKTLDLLAKHGIRDIVRYPMHNDAARVAAVQAISDRQGVRFHRNPDGVVRAVTMGKRSWFFLDRYENESQLRGDMREEAGHRLVNELGADWWKRNGRLVYGGQWSAIVREIRENYGFEPGTDGFNHELVAKAFRDFKQGKPGFWRRLLDAIVARVRDLARRLGFDVKLGDAEIRHFIRTMMEAKARAKNPARAMKPQMNADARGSEPMKRGALVPMSARASSGGVSMKGRRLSEVRNDIPSRSLDAGRLIGTKRDNAAIMRDAGEKFADIYGKTITAADGAEVRVRDAVYSTQLKMLQHLIFNNKTKSLDAEKAAWLPMIRETLENASVRLIDPQTDNRVYVARYAATDGDVLHMVIVRPSGRIVGEHIERGTLVTQFPYGREGRQMQFVVDWENVNGRFQGNPATTPTASPIPGSQRKEFRGQTTPGADGVKFAAGKSPMIGKTAGGEFQGLEVDGKMRPVTDSTGKRIHPTDAGVRNFWRWFGDSKVVDAQGRPVRVFHGTTADFTEFDHGKRGTSTRHPSAQLGFFFSGSPDGASLFTEAVDESVWPFRKVQQRGANVVPAFLRISKPFELSVEKFREMQAIPHGAEVEAEQPEPSAKYRAWFEKNRALLESQEYDGIKIAGDSKYDDVMGGQEYAYDTFVAFDPSQIKSATGNTGAFSPKSGDIRFAKGKPRTAGDLLAGDERVQDARAVEADDIAARDLADGKLPPEIEKATVNPTRWQMFWKRLDADRFFRDILVPVSSRLGTIDEALKARMRRFEFNLMQHLTSDANALLPLAEFVIGKPNVLGVHRGGLSKADADAFKYAALSSGGGSAAAAVLERNGAPKAVLDDFRTMMDGIHGRLVGVGLLPENFEDRKNPVKGYVFDYWPRMAKDPQRLIEYLEQQYGFGAFDAAWKKASEKVSRQLTQEERAMIADKVARGYGKRINFFDPSFVKERLEMTPELADLYLDPIEAALRYIKIANDQIEGRKFFGQTENDMPELNDMETSIGHFIEQLRSEGLIKDKQQDELRDLLQVRFGYKPTTGILAAFKNLGYITSMGNVFSAITQLGDMAWTFHSAGVGLSLKHAARFLAGKSKLTVKDIGAEHIAQEFMDGGKTAKALQSVFKLSGLTFMDRLGKETFINATLEKLRKLALNKLQRAALAKKWKPYFGDETEALLNDVAAGRISENVKLLAFNMLSDFQPISLSEMPRKYLESPGGRVLYMLKTYSVKQLDVFRREAISLMHGNHTREEKLRGFTNLLRLIGMLVLANASADVIKDWLSGRETTMSDRVVENIMRLFGWSRYMTRYAAQEGPTAAIAKLALPVFPFIEAPSRDATKAFNAWRNDELDETTVRNLETWQTIPLAGKLYYWWLGGGIEKREKQEQRNAAEE